MKVLSLVSFLLVLVASITHAQSMGNSEDAGNIVVRGANVASSGNSSYNNAYLNTGQRQMTQFINDTTMYVTVTGLSNVKADNYVAIFAVAQMGSSVDSATILAGDRIKRFTESLKKL